MGKSRAFQRTIKDLDVKVFFLKVNYSSFRKYWWRILKRSGNPTNPSSSWHRSCGECQRTQVMRESRAGGGGRALYGFNTGTRRTRVNQVLIVILRERLKGESLLSLCGGSRMMGVRVRSDSSLWVWDRHLLLLSVSVSDVCGFCCPLGTNKCNYTRTVTADSQGPMKSILFFGNG